MSSDSAIVPTFEPQPGDERLTTAMISDSLDAIGLRHQTTTRLSPVVPGVVCIGRARTLRFVPTGVDAPDGPYDDAIAYIDALRPGHLVVSATGGNDVTATWGELFSAAAKGRGAVAAVTDGAVRDRAKIQAVGFPVYSATCRPNDFRGRMRVESVGERVTFHGIEISDGDLLAIDDDGMAVVPQAHEQEVLSLARERATAESDVLADLLAGETLSSVWERYRIL